MKVKPRPQRKPRYPPAEASVYDGKVMLGVISPEDGAFVASNAAGDRIGVFETDELAMRAIVEAGKASRPAAEAGAA